MAQSAETKQRRASPVVVALVLVALVAVLVAGYLVLTRRDMAVLYEGMRPAEASAVAEELDARSIPYEISDGGAAVLIPAGLRDATRVKLAGAELPLSGQDGFELFDTSDIGLTEFAQRIKYQRALQGELTRTIMKMEGVIEARIHVSIAERSTFRSERAPSKAAVTILTRSPEIETPETIAGIQQLVAAAIVDLAPSDVVVLNGRGAIISPPPAAVLPVPAFSADGTSLLNALIRAMPADAAPRVTSLSDPGPPTQESNASGRRLTVTTARALTVDERSAALAAIKAWQAADAPEAQVSFELRSAQLNSPAVSPRPAADAIDRSPASASGNAASTTLATPDLTAWAIGLFVFGLVIAAALFVFSRLPTQRLSVDDQRRFAERLSIGLQSQGAESVDGTP